MERERLRGREKREGCPQWFWFNQGRPLFDRGQALAFGRSRLSLLTSHDNSSPTLSSFISLTTTLYIFYINLSQNFNTIFSNGLTTIIQSLRFESAKLSE